MGEGAYIRIQNKSQHAVEIKVVEGTKIDGRGIDEIQGVIEAGEQLPAHGGETPFGDSRRYQYIEGDVRFFWQDDGHFHLEAHPTNGAPRSGLKLLVDSDEWWSEDPSPDEDSPVLMVADVDDDSDPRGRTRIEIRVFDNYSGSGWMGQLGDHIGGTPFNRVALPGTHDSGTYAFNDELGAAPDSALTMKIDDIIGRVDALADMVLGQIFKKLCQCQTLSFGKQLEEGIRYFDMRIARHADSNTFHTCHGVFCVELSDILNQFKEFLSSNPKEIVILDFNHLYAMDDHHEDLVDMVLEAFGEKVANIKKVKATSPVKHYWEQGYQVVIVYHNTEVTKMGKYSGLLMHGGYVRSPWPEASTTDALRSKLATLSVEKRHPSAFFVLQGILTPDGELIRRQIMHAKGVSIRSFSGGCNTQFVDWITGDDADGKLKLSCDRGVCEKEEDEGRATSIVIVDYVENGSVIPAVINSNRTG